MAAKTYMAYNSAMATTAQPVVQPSGASTIRTMMQLAPAFPIRAIAWSVSMNGAALAAPGIVELIDTGTIFATMSTAYAAADIQPYSDPNAPANTTGTSGFPINLGTSLGGFATGSVTEGSITSTRMGDVQQIDPVNAYGELWPLGREFEVSAGHCLRIRAGGFAVSVGLICYVIFEI